MGLTPRVVVVGVRTNTGSGDEALLKKGDPDVGL
jgi:hypothetical protein